MLLIHDAINQCMNSLEDVYNSWSDIDIKRYEAAKSYLLKAYNILTPLVYSAPTKDI